MATTPELDYQRKRREAYGRGENPDLTTSPPSNMEKMPKIYPGSRASGRMTTLPRAKKLTPPPKSSLGPPQVLYGPNGPPGLNKPPGSKRAIGKGLSGIKGKALLAELAKKKLKMRGQGG